MSQEMKKSKIQKAVGQIQEDEEKMNIDQLFTYRIYVNIIRYDQISSLA